MQSDLLSRIHVNIWNGKILFFNIRCLFKHTRFQRCAYFPNFAKANVYAPALNIYIKYPCFLFLLFIRVTADTSDKCIGKHAKMDRFIFFQNNGTNDKIADYTLGCLKNCRRCKSDGYDEKICATNIYDANDDWMITRVINKDSARGK